MECDTLSKHGLCLNCTTNVLLLTKNSYTIMLYCLHYISIRMITERHHMNSAASSLQIRSANL